MDGTSISIREPTGDDGAFRSASAEHAEALYACAGMRLPGGGSVVVDNTGWTNVKLTYSAITTKLEEPVDTQTKLKAIDYWIARLNQDRASIASGHGPVRD